jgi:chromate transporter
VLAFLALFLFVLPFPLVIGTAAALGLARSLTGPAAELAGAGAKSASPKAGQAFATAFAWAAVWLAPLAGALAVLGPDHLLTRVGVLFSKLALVTFGGAYTVLAYLQQQAVEAEGWLTAPQMIDGLGLAETTPGPLILVTQFVGYLAAFRAPEPFSPLVAGLLGAVLTTWVTFAPCFLWIFALAPWIERLGHAVRLKGALAAVTAAVVGVIANLTAWFALHVLFAQVGEVQFGPVRLDWPLWASFDWRAGVLAALAVLLAFRLRWSVLRILAACAAGGIVLSLLL